MKPKTKPGLALFAAVMLTSLSAQANPDYYPAFTITDSFIVPLAVVLSSLIIEFAFVKGFAKFSAVKTIAAVIVMNLASAIGGAAMFIMLIEVRYMNETNLGYFFWLPSLIQLSTEGAVLHYLFKHAFSASSFFLFALANTITLISGAAIIGVAVR